MPLRLHLFAAGLHLRPMTKLIPAALALLSLASCASAPEASPAVGRLYHYIRSNQDGSEPEHIYQYRASATRVEVGKMVAPCTNAAYVTGELDLEHETPIGLTGGRIARDGSQEAFAWLTYDRATRRLHARVPVANIDQDVAVDGEPWLLYDFDLAELNAFRAGRPAPRSDFRFAVALIWLAEGEGPFRNLHWANARFAGMETHHASEAARYDVSGGLNGQLWLDAREGHVLEARFAEPNHAGYTSFRLALQSVTNDGETAWREARLAHWRGCPA